MWCSGSSVGEPTCEILHACEPMNRIVYAARKKYLSTDPTQSEQWVATLHIGEGGASDRTRAHRRRRMPPVIQPALDVIGDERTCFFLNFFVAWEM